MSRIECCRYIHIHSMYVRICMYVYVCIYVQYVYVYIYMHTQQCTARSSTRFTYLTFQLVKKAGVSMYDYTSNICTMCIYCMCTTACSLLCEVCITMFTQQWQIWSRLHGIMDENHPLPVARSATAPCVHMSLAVVGFTWRINGYTPRHLIALIIGMVLAVGCIQPQEPSRH